MSGEVVLLQEDGSGRIAAFVTTLAVYQLSPDGS